MGKLRPYSGVYTDMDVSCFLQQNITMELEP